MIVRRLGKGEEGEKDESGRRERGRVKQERERKERVSERPSGQSLLLLASRPWHQTCE
jgi:hypothetical protein